MKASSRKRLIAQIATQENRPGSRLRDTRILDFRQSSRQAKHSGAHEITARVAKRELDEVAMQFRDLEFQNNQLPPTPADSSIPEAISHRPIEFSRFRAVAVHSTDTNIDISQLISRNV